MSIPVAVCWVIEVIALARPKSATLTRPSSAISTFSGLTSRWISPAWWAAASAATTGVEQRERAAAAASGCLWLIASRSVCP